MLILIPVYSHSAANPPSPTPRECIELSQLLLQVVNLLEDGPIPLLEAPGPMVLIEHPPPPGLVPGRDSGDPLHRSCSGVIMGVL